MNIFARLVRKKDNVWVRAWEDRDTPDYKGWALGRLAWAIYVNKKPHSHVRKFWNQSLDHRTIALLAINARFNNLPDFVTVHCNKNQAANMVTTPMVNRLCNSSKDTLLKIIKMGIETGDLCQVKNPPGYKGICFTAGKPLMQAYSIKEDPKDVIKKLSEATTDDCVFR